MTKTGLAIELCLLHLTSIRLVGVLLSKCVCGRLVPAVI